MCCKLSIIVPVYMVEPYIRKCIDSILAQTFTDFELILVDDGSPDNCGKICDEYVEIDSRIKVIHKENGGLSSARNAGLDIMQGEYIGFVDSDDYIEKDMYETMYSLANSYDADLVECGFIKVKGDDLKVISHNVEIEVGGNLFALNKLMNYWFHSLVCNKIYKKSIFSELRFPYGKIHEDEFIMHRVFFALNKYVYTGKSEYFYVQREGSIMEEGYSLKTLDRLEALADRYYYLKEKIKEDPTLSLVETRYFNEIANNYHMLSINNKLDLDKRYRRGLREHILKNYGGFANNSLLKEYRHWMVLLKLNGTVFHIFYNIHRKCLSWYYNTRHKCKTILSSKIRKFYPHSTG